MADGQRGRPRPRLPGGLRGRLAILISLLVVGVLVGTFFAVRQTTRSELESRLDDDLELQYREFAEFPAVKAASKPRALQEASSEFLSSQRYHPASTIFVIELDGADTVTNEPEVVEAESEEEGQGSEAEGDEATLLDAPLGFADVSAEDAGALRVFSHEIARHGESVGTFRVGEPLAAIEEAESGLVKSFLVVGVVALALAIGAAFWIADRLTGPLRRMSRTASGIEAGALSQRIGDLGAQDEVQTLADAFDHMLDRLEWAFQRQRDFVSDASHELRTPLTVLRGELDLLRRPGAEATERERSLEILAREVERMGRLVDDMLTLARAESGTLLELRQIDLEDFVDDLRRDLPLFGERNYELRNAPDGTLTADPDRLSQVLRNLIRNAVQHTGPEGRIEIRIEPAGGRLGFAISDDGPGIAEADLELIFDRFHRTDIGRSRGEGGAGLGLAIARAIVQAHGGRIWAESQAGGATIRFELPGFEPVTHKSPLMSG